MGELTSALDALAADDLKPMFGPALLDRAAELLEARNRIDAELTRTVRMSSASIRFRAASSSAARLSSAGPTIDSRSSAARASRAEVSSPMTPPA